MSCVRVCSCCGYVFVVLEMLCCCKRGSRLIVGAWLFPSTSAVRNLALIIFSDVSAASWIFLCDNAALSSTPVFSWLLVPSSVQSFADALSPRHLLASVASGVRILTASGAVFIIVCLFSIVLRSFSTCVGSLPAPVCED